MAFITADRVQETTATVGTGPLALAGAVTADGGSRSFASQMSVADTCEYCIKDAIAGAWEVGIGTYSAVNTLTRTTVQSSSNANAAVSLAGNAATAVFLTLPASRVALIAGRAPTFAPSFTGGVTVAGGATVTGPTVLGTPLPIASGGTAAATVTLARSAINRGTVALTSAATITTDASTGNNFTVTLGVSGALANPTNLAAGASYAWTIRQDATGGRLLTYGTAFKWPGGVVPTLSTAANAVDLVTAISDGTNLYAVVSKGFA